MTEYTLTPKNVTLSFGGQTATLDGSLTLKLPNATGIDPSPDPDPTPKPDPIPPAIGTGAATLGASTTLQAAVDFTLDPNKSWAIGGWYRFATASGAAELVSTSNTANSYLVLARDGDDSSKIVCRLHNGATVLSLDKYASVGQSWFFVAVFCDGAGKVELMIARPGDTNANAVHNAGQFKAAIDVRQYAVGVDITDGASAARNHLIGDVAEQFVFTDHAITEAGVIDVTSGDKTVADLGEPVHYWGLQAATDIADRGSAATPLTATGDALKTANPPDTAKPQPAPTPDPTPQPPTSGNPPPSANLGSVDDQSTWAHDTTITPGATGASVTLHATAQIQHGGSTTISATAAPGHRVRTKDSSGKPYWISLRHHADGSCCIENMYCNGPGNISLTNVKLTLDGSSGKTLFSDDVMIYLYTRTRPFFYRQPVARKLNANLVPKFGADGGRSASVASSYDNLSTYSAKYSDIGANHFPFAANNDLKGPMGIGMFLKGLGTTGGRSDLGLLPQWDAVYVTNPTADNARIVKEMGSSACPFPHHALDPATNKMLLVTDRPKATLLDALIGAPHNPCRHKAGYPQPVSLAQAAAHAPAIGYLAALTFGSEVFVEETEFWANYVCSLWQNNGYRTHGGAGANPWGRAQARGTGWSLRQCAQAATVTRDFKDYFDFFMAEYARTGLDHVKNYHSKNQIQIFGDIIYQNFHGCAPWQNDFIVMAMGFAIQLGFTDMKEVLSYAGTFQTQRLNAHPHEIAPIYEIRVKDSNGKIVANWDEALALEAKTNGGLRRAMAEKEGTLAVLEAFGYKAPLYKAGDFTGYPFSANGYPAYMRAAMSFCKRYNVAGADNAWKILTDHYRGEHEHDPRYYLVP